ncbi:hypothetical protein [Streptomyces sp. NPDC018031]|uniref:hypothetical protein n=1 Tax=Streptomyces sp. NPDC018031 TaxID=3365033 RepID=UPI00379DB7A4
MVFLLVALLLMGVVLGTVAHVPVPVTLVGAALIAAWLAVFTLRERHARRRAR